MKKLTFDQFKEIMNSIEVPAQRIGIFRIKINNNNKRYYFTGLKINASYNDNMFGFGLNHYGWLGLPKQSFKRSQFHDEEDVSIEVSRDIFQYAYKTEGFNEMSVSTKTWTAQINW